MDKVSRIMTMAGRYVYLCEPCHQRGSFHRVDVTDDVLAIVKSLQPTSSSQKAGEEKIMELLRHQVQRSHDCSDGCTPCAEALRLLQAPPEKGEGKDLSGK